MGKAYLAHSSKDKNRFIKPLADRLGKDRCVYDDYTFEEGMKLIEEIDKGLNQSDLFVLFISESALESEWVKSELDKAYKLLCKKSLKRIYPIIIDEKITHDDSRLPSWMNEYYNLKYVSRITVAHRRISSRLREIGWDFHPRLKEREEIFVGRNDLLKLFEERIDSMDLPLPNCVVASGLPRIGRSTLLIHCLRKSNIINDSYRPQSIIMNKNESIEDLICKVYDLGLSSVLDLKNLTSKSMPDKIELAYKLLLDFESNRERLAILDNGCLIKYHGNVAPWFLELIKKLRDKEYIYFAVAARHKIITLNKRARDYIFFMRVSELTATERAGLLKRYAEFENVNLNKDDFMFFACLLTGFPEQIFYVIELINGCGLPQTKHKASLISEFGRERISGIIQKYENNQFALDLLRLLAEFEMVNYDMLIEITCDEKKTMNLLSEFFVSCICEYIGPCPDYIKLNDAVRDHINRIKIDLPNAFKSRIRTHIKNFVNQYEPGDTDVSDFLYSTKKALLDGEEIKEEYLIPSHYLKTLKESYDNRKYNAVINLADRILAKEAFSVVNIDPDIIFQIRYQLCLSLARTRNERFKSEVREIKGIEYDFLFGYYYRLTGKTDLAIERYKKILGISPSHTRAKRELVQAYLQNFSFEEAELLAKQNYESDKYNSYHIQAYIRCLFEKRHVPDTKKIIKELLDRLQKIKSKHAEEVFYINQTKYLSLIKGDKTAALSKMEEAIDRFPDSIYVKFESLEILEKYNDLERMEKIVEDLKKEIERGSHLYSSLIYKEATVQFKKGDKAGAYTLLDKELSTFPVDLLEKFKSKINQ